MTDRSAFKPGEIVEIIHGPFRTAMGEIEEVNNEKQMLKVLVDLKNGPLSMGVDSLPIELRFREVKKRTQ